MKIKHETIKSITLTVSKDIHSTGKVQVDENGFMEIDGDSEKLCEIPGFSVAEETKKSKSETVDEYRTQLEAKAKALKINFPANIKTETLEAKVKEAEEAGE